MCAHGTHIITLLVSFLEPKLGWPGPRRLSGISTWQPRTAMNEDKFTKNIMKNYFCDVCVFIITAKLKLTSWGGAWEMARSCPTVKRLGMPVKETNTARPQPLAPTSMSTIERHPPKPGSFPDPLWHQPFVCLWFFFQPQATFLTLSSQLALEKNTPPT